MRPAVPSGNVVARGPSSPCQLPTGDPPTLLHAPRWAGARTFVAARPHLDVLADHPALKHGVEQGRGNAAENAAEEKHPKVGHMLGEAADGVRQHVQQRRPLPPTAANTGYGPGELRRERPRPPWAEQAAGPRHASHATSGLDGRRRAASRRLPARWGCAAAHLPAVPHTLLWDSRRLPPGSTAGQQAHPPPTHYLSARVPIAVPKTMEDPNPAMNRRPISPREKP